jgi:modulator of FtsH protease
MKEWNDFFIACSGAAAALTGLVFVGVSISLARILSIKTLPDRALISLGLLLSILIVSLFQLVPGQWSYACSIETLLLGIILWFIVSYLDRRIYKYKPKEHKGSYMFHILLNQVSSIPYIIGGICGLCNCNCANYFITLAIITSFLKAVFDSWVLLIEINR